MPGGGDTAGITGPRAGRSDLAGRSVRGACWTIIPTASGAAGGHRTHESAEGAHGVVAGEPDTEAFRAELRAWLEDHLTPEVVEAGGHQIEGESLEVLRAWNRTLADGGWAAPSWPVEHGGRGAGVPEQLAYLEETNRVGPRARST